MEIDRTYTAGGTDVSELSYMKMKGLLSERGIGKGKLDACPSLLHLKLLGLKEGLLTSNDVEDPAESPEKAPESSCPEREALNQEQEALLRTISDIAREGLIGDDIKGMLKEELYSGVPIEAMRLKVENLADAARGEDGEPVTNMTTSDPGALIPSEESQSSVCEVWIVRHGERWDEVPGNEWHREAGDAWHDPPLTDKGKGQATKAAELLASAMQRNGVEAFLDHAPRCS